MGKHGRLKEHLKPAVPKGVPQGAGLTLEVGLAVPASRYFDMGVTNSTGQC